MTNLSVNPARSTGPASFCGGWALVSFVYRFVEAETMLPAPEPIVGEVTR